MTKKEVIDTRQLSVEVQEIISKKPGWFLRYGISLFALIIVGLIAITFFITYPDIITAKAEILEMPNSQFGAKAYFSQKNAGRIIKGQKVLLKLLAYPFQEFGAVVGYVDSISTISTDSGYLVIILLPNGLRSSYNKNLQYYSGLSAQAEIITGDLRLSDRLINQIMPSKKE